MITLGIETSCDETGVGIVSNGSVLANVVSSQIAHTKYGGVVPEIAARNHLKVILPLTRLALEIAGITLKDIDLIAATRGPGLIGSIITGLSFAKSMAIGLKKPFIGINHLEGHIYALCLSKHKPTYPFLTLLVSGGHTEIIIVKRKFQYETLGKTLDDACGEAFDKVAKMLGLPYPGGPYIERTARLGRPGGVKFPIPRVKDFNFSYAGLKTAVLYYLRGNPDYNINDVAYNFQEAAFEHLLQVLGRVIDSSAFRIKCIGVVGGVAANKRLAEKFLEFSKKREIKILIPDFQFCTDNGAMIALAGEWRFKKFGPSNLSLEPVAREPLG